VKKIITILLLISVSLCLNAQNKGAGKNKQDKIVDNTTLHGKWLTGYQAWARTPNDGTNAHWQHYFWGKDFAPERLVVDFLPDTSDFKDEDKEIVDGLFKADGLPVALVSGNNPNVIDEHFKWMRDYDIDGVWLQKFLMSSKIPNVIGDFEVRNKVMDEVVKASKKYGRVWAINFDPPAIPKEKLFDVIVDEWKRMVDLGYTKLENRYLHHEGVPVVHIWAITCPDAHRETSPELGLKLLEFFGQEGKYQAYFIAGAAWCWARDRHTEWKEFYDKARCIVPWNVGHAPYDQKDKVSRAYVANWVEDKATAENLDLMWIPTIYPGFAWVNMYKNAENPPPIIERRKGQFLWDQLYAISRVEPDCVLLAMFDEVDEGTAFFKIEPNPPTGMNLLDTEGMPSDWSMQLIREARRIIREGEDFPKEIQLKPKK